MTPLAELLPAFTFDEQRAQCARCRHRIEMPIKASRAENARVVLRCNVISGKRSCSLARAPDGQCGPDAKLFQAEVFQ
ncbi:hypothetical protein [Roseateles chitosanitabidus]|uniref:hypothetical protein n=1 Tax=Roseateles chitosanitabidus TaxID=65048 RepID=UPI000831E546|nr:hypothetical protein [Roseateles chitosanitabidus]